MTTSTPAPAPASPAPQAGAKAPAFSLPDQQNKTHHLKDYLGRWVVLYFYPKDDTPGCTQESCQFRDGLAQFTQRKAVVLGLSPDDSASHLKFAQKFNLPFPLLADTDQKTCLAYGVWKEKHMYGRKFMGVERTTCLIDPQGKIAHRWEKVKVPDHDTAVLAKIDELSKP